MTASAFRLGFFTHVEGGRDFRQTYLNTRELFIAAEELGFDTGWVAHHHFWIEEDTGGLPSPWVFLAGIAAETRHIHLGTAVTVLPLENPLRLAQDVAVLDTISSGRVELGVGSGYDRLSYEVFGQDYEAKRERTRELLAELRGILDGRPLHPSGTTLTPPGAGIARSRLWQGVFSESGAAWAGRQRVNLLLNRAAYGYDESTDRVQRPWADAYLAARPEDAPGRVGISRLIFPAADEAAALAQIGPGVRRALDYFVSQGAYGDLGDDSLDNALFRMNAYWGHPDDIVHRLEQERVLPVATDLLAQFDPGTPTLDASLKALELLAREVAPRLGWVSSRTA